MGEKQTQSSIHILCLWKWVGFAANVEFAVIGSSGNGDIQKFVLFSELRGARKKLDCLPISCVCGSGLGWVCCKCWTGGYWGFCYSWDLDNYVVWWIKMREKQAHLSSHVFSLNKSTTYLAFDIGRVVDWQNPCPKCNMKIIKDGRYGDFNGWAIFVYKSAREQSCFRIRKVVENCKNLPWRDVVVMWLQRFVIIWTVTTQKQILKQEQKGITILCTCRWELGLESWGLGCRH